MTTVEEVERLRLPAIEAEDERLKTTETLLRITTEEFVH